ncbi:hypothetical protein [Brevibacterium sediminis]|nr:hypothetical protein [Brevibacterium sediminis]
MTALHVFAHDAESTDEVVGTGGTLKGLGELVAERHNERGDGLRNRFQRYGFDSDDSAEATRSSSSTPRIWTRPSPPP